MAKPLRILIVEDEPEWANPIKTHLLEILNDLNLPCTIEAPASIRECKKAIRSARETPYDLISLDISFSKDEAEEPTHGVNLLRDIHRNQAAWLVSILTGVEADSSLEDTYGEAWARKLQGELRSLACASFPPERLLFLEKPAPDDAERLGRRLRDICLVLRQSLVGRNLFRPMVLPCQVAIHQTIHGDWIKQDSDAFRRARKAMDFVKKYKSAQDEETKKKYEEESETSIGKERKLDILVKVGPSQRLKNAKWEDDAVSLRQIRYGCGEVVTLTDAPYFETIAWLLYRPGEEFAAHEIGGDAPDARRLSEDFKHSHDDEELGEGEYEGDEHLNRDRRGEDRDFDQDSGGASGDWDSHEAESHAAYRNELKRNKAELESATGQRRKTLLEDIEALKQEMGKVRKKPVGGKSHGLIKQHKSRAIAALKEAGQVDLADHLERTIWIEEKKKTFSYHMELRSIFWNVV